MLVGIGCGLTLAMIGVARAASDTFTTVRVASAVLFLGAVAGASGGALFVALSRWRASGVGGTYLVWVVTCTIGYGVAELGEALARGQLPSIPIILMFGCLFGFGFGTMDLVARREL